MFIISKIIIISIIIYKSYSAKSNDYTEIYIIQIGAYESYDNVIKNTRNLENYLIWNEDNLYKIYVGLTLNDDIYNKILKKYNITGTPFKKTLKITDSKLIKSIENYDEILKNTDNKNNMNMVIKEELKLLENFLHKIAN